VSKPGGGVVVEGSKTSGLGETHGTDVFHGFRLVGCQGVGSCKLNLAASSVGSLGDRVECGGVDEQGIDNPGQDTP
jgi:hypothetical protein